MTSIDESIPVQVAQAVAPEGGVGPTGPPGEVDTEPQSAPNGTMTTRICDYFSSERGCVKAERCDFLHIEGRVPQADLAADAGGKKLCDFYLSERGCVKEDRCDFLHPVAPNGSVTKRVCDYFGTRRGCAKEIRCDFLHINAAVRAKETQQQQQPAVLMPQMAAYGAYAGYTGWGATPGAATAGATGMPGTRPAVATQAQATGNTRVCQFYQEPRGCAKEERCDFVHQGPSASTPILPTPTSQAAGAIPGADQMALLQDPHAQYAAYYSAYGQQAAAAAAAAGASPAGQSLYSYGATDPYAAYAQAQAQPAASPAVAGASGQRVCSFFSTARGCRKGDRCDFAHPADASAKPASVRYSPY